MLPVFYHLALNCITEASTYALHLAWQDQQLFSRVQHRLEAHDESGATLAQNSSHNSGNSTTCCKSYVLAIISAQAYSQARGCERTARRGASKKRQLLHVPRVQQKTNRRAPKPFEQRNGQGLENSRKRNVRIKTISQTTLHRLIAGSDTRKTTVPHG